MTEFIYLVSAAAIPAMFGFYAGVSHGLEKGRAEVWSSLKFKVGATVVGMSDNVMFRNRIIGGGFVSRDSVTVTPGDGYSYRVIVEAVS